MLHWAQCYISIKHQEKTNPEDVLYDPRTVVMEDLEVHQIREWRQ